MLGLFSCFKVLCARLTSCCLLLIKLTLEHLGYLCRTLLSSLSLAKRENTFRDATMLFLLIVFLVGVVNIDTDALQVLTVHSLTRSIRTVEVIERDEAIAARATRLWISLHLGAKYNTELRKDFAQETLINML